MTGLLLILVVLFIPAAIGGMIYVASGSQAGDDATNQKDVQDIQDPSLVLDVAERHEEDDNYREAIQAWSRYQQLESDDPAGFFRRGINWQRLDEYERALEDFERVEERSDELPPMLWYYRAKCYAALDREDEALSAYESYLQGKPEDLSAWEPVARWATRKGYRSRARTLWKHIREHAESPRRERALLYLTEIDLENDDVEQASGRLERLDHDSLGQDLEKYYLYLKGRLREEQGRGSEALEQFRTLLDRDPDFRDAKERFRNHKPDSDGDDFLEQYQSLPPDSFAEFCQDLVRDMGLKVTEVEIHNDEEVTVECRDSSGLIGDVDRYVFAFKRWENEAGQMTLKDFEMSLLEERFDRGYFISPGGFNQSARRLAEGNPDLILKKPEDVLGEGTSPDPLGRTSAVS